MAKAPLAVARDESRTDSWMLLKLPMVVGVPLMVMVLPLSAAESPGGNPVAVRLPVGAVPPRMGTAPLKPVWFTDQVFVESVPRVGLGLMVRDRKSTRLNSSHLVISYAVFCLKKKKKKDMNV